MIDICGDDDRSLFTEKLNLKRAHAGGVNPLHQDYPYWEDVADDADTDRHRDAVPRRRDDRERLSRRSSPGSHRGGMRTTRTDSDPFGNLEMDPAEFSGGDRGPARGRRRLGRVLRPVPRAQVGAEPLDADRRSLLFSYQPHGHRHLREIDASNARRARLRPL